MFGSMDELLLALSSRRKKPARLGVSDDTKINSRRALGLTALPLHFKSSIDTMESINTTIIAGRLTQHPWQTCFVVCSIQICHP